MEIADMRPLRLVQVDRTLLKVSSVYSTHITAQVLVEDGKLPWRTTVRSYMADKLGSFREPSPQILARYEDLKAGRQ